jgi:hypothetical protein
MDLEEKEKEMLKSFVKLKEDQHLGFAGSTKRAVDQNVDLREDAMQNKYEKILMLSTRFLEAIILEIIIKYGIVLVLG